ncbi:MAG: ATP-grasp domain-containing protein [Okeania sp. SIO2C9]|nr:ATP-grasp domain-containing protein [Okeania sp. SIO2C9]
MIESHLNKFTNFLEKFGNFARVKNFPAHIQLRINSNGILLPIEDIPLIFLRNSCLKC